MVAISVVDIDVNINFGTKRTTRRLILKSFKVKLVEKIELAMISTHIKHLFKNIIQFTTNV